jgi:hypothetical protein
MNWSINLSAAFSSDYFRVLKFIILVNTGLISGFSLQNDNS